MTLTWTEPAWAATARAKGTVVWTAEHGWIDQQPQPPSHGRTAAEGATTMGLDGFWKMIEAQLEKLREAKTAAEVVAICPPVEGVSCGDGFFGGSGGGETPYGPLRDAGWTTVSYEAEYHWTLRAPDGSEIEYVEGDLYVSEAA